MILQIKLLKEMAEAVMSSSQIIKVQGVDV
jgi:hypothetical protein